MGREGVVQVMLSSVFSHWASLSETIYFVLYLKKADFIMWKTVSKLKGAVFQVLSLGSVVLQDGTFPHDDITVPSLVLET